MGLTARSVAVAWLRELTKRMVYQACRPWARALDFQRYIFGAMWQSCSICRQHELSALAARASGTEPTKNSVTTCRSASLSRRNQNRRSFVAEAWFGRSYRRVGTVS